MADTTRTDTPTASLEPELRLSPAPVISALIALAVLLFMATERMPNVPVRGQVQSLVLLLLVAAGATWLLLAWKPPAACWFAVIECMALIHIASTWLCLPEIQSLQVVPVVMAGTVVGLPAAAVATLLASASLLAPGAAVTRPGLAAVGANLAAAWAVCALVGSADRRVQRVAHWASGYSQRAEALLEETRGRRAELEQALRDLAHANRQLALTNERTATLRLIAEEAQRAKSEFVARVSHEFRTPLNMIIGLVELMVETPDIYAEELPPELRRDLEIVHHNCEHLASMINDVLDLSRVEAGRLTLHREPVSLAEVVRDVIEIVQPLAQKKQLYLRVVVADQLPEIDCDRTRIRQVLLNLVSNAVRFTVRGGITVQAARRGQHVLIDVLDTGPGIAAEDVQRVFEPFWQSTSSAWHERDGTGLGLSISRQLVELHGGRMWVESQLGAGTTIHVELPIAEQPKHARRPAQWLREDWVWREAAFKGARAAAAESLTRPRVVVWDRTGGLYSECTRYTDRAEFIEASDLAGTLHALNQCPVRAVLLNACSIGDLAQTADVLRRESPTTPVVGATFSRTMARAEEAGALGHLVKPVTHSHIERALHSVGPGVRRVLVVDDDPNVCQLLRRMLRACDSTLEVQSVGSAAQALASMNQAPPDLLLLDIILPDISGWEVLERMRHVERLSAVPVFMVSAQDPVYQTPLSSHLLAAMGDGLTVSCLLRCLLAVSALMLAPD